MTSGTQLRLDASTPEHLADFEAAGFAVPTFDVAAMREATAAAPRWVHLGAGNLFRSLHSVIAQDTLNAGAMDTGIVLVNTRGDTEIRNYAETDQFFLNVVMKADGSLDPTVVASVAESHHLFAGTTPAWEHLRAIFRCDSLQMTTVCITEKGYKLRGADGEFLPDAAADLAAGPGESSHAMTVLASLLYARFEAGATPIALVSTDNFSANGQRLADAIAEVAHEWNERGLVSDEFLAYATDPARVSFPWTMVDRITPAPSAGVAQMLTDRGVADAALKIRPDSAPLAVFSNTEEVRYLVIEDSFPNGRPALDKGGVLFTDRETVNRADRMKVCTCLNPLHTAMAVLGCTLDYTSIAQESTNKDVMALVHQIGYVEGLPVVTDPGIISPKSFIDEVVTKRIPNPGIPDTPQRIATDTSQKVGIRFGETISIYASKGEGASLHAIPFAIAAWIRYLLALDDEGAAFELSSDPLADYLHGFVADIHLGEPDSVGDRLHPLLSNAEIFGIDLYEAGVGETVENFTRKLVAGPGAVAQELHTFVTAGGHN